MRDLILFKINPNPDSICYIPMLFIFIMFWRIVNLDVMNKRMLLFYVVLYCIIYDYPVHMENYCVTWPSTITKEDPVYLIQMEVLTGTYYKRKKILQEY